MTTPAVVVTGDFSASFQLLDGIGGRAHDLRPVFRGPIDRSLTSFYTQQFDTAGVAGGFPWAPLKKSTIVARTRASHGGRARTGKRGRARAGFSAILRDTSRGWASFVKAGGPESIRIIGRHQMERGSAVPYMAAHHKAHHNRPARPVVPEPLPRWLTLLWERVIARYVIQGNKALGDFGTKVKGGTR